MVHGIRWGKWVQLAGKGSKKRGNTKKREKARESGSRDARKRWAGRFNYLVGYMHKKVRQPRVKMVNTPGKRVKGKLMYFKQAPQNGGANIGRRPEQLG